MAGGAAVAEAFDAVADSEEAGGVGSLRQGYGGADLCGSRRDGLGDGGGLAAGDDGGDDGGDGGQDGPGRA